MTQSENKFSIDHDVQNEYDQEQRTDTNVLELFPKMNVLIPKHKCSS